MVASWLPASTTQRVQAVDGVGEAIPILYSTDTITAGTDRSVAYVVGLPPRARAGGAWSVVDGESEPLPGSILLDAGVARRAGADLGDTVTVLGRDEHIGGLTEGTSSLVNSVAFMSIADFEAARGSGLVSFVLVRVEPGKDAGAIAAEIERRVPGVTAQTTPAFADQERRLVMDMSADVITIMDGIGSLVALAVLSLTVYVSTLARRRELAILKAIGARDATLARSVAVQTAIIVAIALILGTLVTAGVAFVVPRVGVPLAPSVTLGSLAKAALSALLAGLAATLLPIWQVLRVEPAIAFSRGGSVR